MPTRLAGVALTGVVAAHTAPALAPVFSPMSRVLGVPRRMEGASAVALTFDDGPHPQGTPAVLELLRAAAVPATFFLVGEQVERQRSLAAEVAAEGHGIAIHCRRHRNLLRLTRAQIRDDLDRAEEAIHAATGQAPLLHRPPYGIYSWQALSLVRRRGWQPLLWSRWGRDWSARATPETIAHMVTRDASRGDVLLLHDSDAYSAEGSWRQTVRALPRVLDELARQELLAARV